MTPVCDRHSNWMAQVLGIPTTIASARQATRVWRLSMYPSCSVLVAALALSITLALPIVTTAQGTPADLRARGKAPDHLRSDDRVRRVSAPHQHFDNPGTGFSSNLFYQPRMAQAGVRVTD